jgi:hypothetical protein
LTNIVWADRFSPFTAHTSYWKVDEENSQRLIDRLIPWLEGGPLAPPADRFQPYLAPYLFWFWILLSSAVLLLFMGSSPWLIRQMINF